MVKSGPIRDQDLTIIDSIADVDDSDALLVAVEQLQLLALVQLEHDLHDMFEVQPEEKFKVQKNSKISL